MRNYLICSLVLNVTLIILLCGLFWFGRIDLKGFSQNDRDKTIENSMRLMEKYHFLKNNEKVIFYGDVCISNGANETPYGFIVNFWMAEAYDKLKIKTSKCYYLKKAFEMDTEKILTSKNWIKNINNDCKGFYSQPTEDKNKPAVKTEQQVSPKTEQTGQQTSSNLFERIFFNGNTRIVPYFKEGVPCGFRVTNIKEGSPPYNMGLRSGDAIRSINGLPITSPESFIQAEQSCAEKSKIIIVIEREGSVINIPLSMR